MANQLDLGGQKPWDPRLNEPRLPTHGEESQAQGERQARDWCRNQLREVSEKLIEAGLLDWDRAEDKPAVKLALEKAIHVWCHADEVE